MYPRLTRIRFFCKPLSDCNMKLESYLTNVAHLSPQVVDDLTALFTRRVLKKGDLLFKRGGMCKEVFYVEQGILRLFYENNQGKDISAWFIEEGCFIAAVDSLFQDTPSKDSCEALENAVVYTASHANLDKLLDHPQGARTAFYALYEITQRLTEYIVALKFQSAEERYNLLIETYPDIFQRANLGHIASFLGITQETLSRIRSKK